MKKALLTVQVASKSDLADLEQVLKSYYDDVMCTGLYRNERDPFKDGWRAFYTLLKEEADVDE